MTDSVKPEQMAPEKMDGGSLDIAEQRRRELKQLLPAVFTETTGADGQPVETIDWERLKAELGTFSDVYEGRRERYGMEWPGKRDCMKVIQEPSRATLKPCREESVDFDATRNLFIEGDNLEVLKLLQKSYYGKVKMIYIDPPYNTGKEFIYPDKFSESLETYLAYAGLVDDQGKKFSTNTAAEGRFHTKWLNMMFPRLYLARNLLAEDGVVFVSIADHEIENLRRMCDEVYGEECHLGTIVWKNSTDNNPTNVAVEHEYIVVYCKNKSGVESEWKSGVSDVKELLISIGIELNKEHDSIEDLQAAYTEWYRDNKSQLWPLDRYKYIDKGGVYTGSQSVHNPGKEGYRYDVIHPETKKPCKQPLMGYRFPRETMDELLEKGKILFGEDHNKIIELKVYAHEYQEKLPSVIELDGRLGSYDVRDLFPEYKKAFTNPKPVRLLQAFVPFLSKSEQDIVLDFFAGSSSTAEAVLRLNAKDGINRPYIMVQLPEYCDEKSEPYKNGYMRLSDVSKERIRRAAQKIRDELHGADSATGNSSIDLGFKVLKLDKSNFVQWGGGQRIQDTSSLEKQLEMHVSHVDQHSTQEDLLMELLLKSGFQPTDRVESVNLGGKKVYSIADGALLICLEEELTADLVDGVADLEPMQFICLDKSFKGNDQLKANAVQTFKSRSQGAETEMVFKVV